MPELSLREKGLSNWTCMSRQGREEKRTVISIGSIPK
jgi:hypothetical protein